MIGDLDLIGQTHIIHYQQCSALSGYSDVFIMHHHTFPLLLFYGIKHGIRNMSMEVVTGKEIDKVWRTVSSFSANTTLFIDWC